MLGLDHYGGALAKVQDYVKGYFVEKTKDKKEPKKSEGEYSIYKRLTSDVDFDASKYGFTNNGSPLVSWIDSFFFANLHIIGITIDEIVALQYSDYYLVITILSGPNRITMKGIRRE